MRVVTSVFPQFAVAFDFADESQHLVVKGNTFRTPSEPRQIDRCGRQDVLQVATAVAINFSRVSAWLEGVPRAATRTSRFVRLVA